MNWYLILMVFALVLCILQAFLSWITTPAPRPMPHLGWLGMAFLIAAFMLERHAT
jgi:hypothetical protein